MKRISALFLSLLILLSSVVIFSAATDSNITSTDYRYTEKYHKARVTFNDFAVLSQQTIPVPGLENTVVSDEICNCMTPQGLCVTEDFIFISAYCNVKKYKTELEENKLYPGNAQKLENEKEHKTYNSVIYIIDRKSGDYIKNLVLPDTNHVGGLASDGKNLFIAKSTDKQVSVITMKQIKRALETKSLSVDAQYEFTSDCYNNASFVVYFDDLLWVGVFNEKENGKLIAFEVENSSFKLNEVTTVSIPAKANGASFADINGQIYLNVNSSYGRKNVSDMYLYSVTDCGTKDMQLKTEGKYMMPPVMQNSCIYDGKMYYIFESAATCYSEVSSVMNIKSTVHAIDRICITDAEDVFLPESGINMLMLRIKCFMNAVSDYINSIIA